MLPTAGISLALLVYFLLGCSMHGYECIVCSSTCMIFCLAQSGHDLFFYLLAGWEAIEKYELEKQEIEQIEREQFDQEVSIATYSLNCS